MNNKIMNKSTGMTKKAFIFMLLSNVGLLIISPAFASVAGKTILAKGEVFATDQTELTIRELKRRSDIFDVDEITTGESSKAQFNMTDGGLITLKENTKVLISDYKYNDETGEGSATLELVNGGLRSISGLIKEKGGDYQVKTPVGSIGIRGTHFVVQVVEENVLFGVYSGNIDVTLANTNQVLSLGSTEDFSFASVDLAGNVTKMLKAPQALAKGFVTEDTDDTGESAAASDEQSLLNTEIDNALNPNFDTTLYREATLQAISDESIADLISERTGSVTYSEVLQSDINSSVGETSDFQISMTVDFDNASVPGGTLSFSDAQGEWYAAYSGLINVDQLELGINFASHGNNKAQGDISAAFSNGLEEVLGSFNLSEINNPTVKSDGSFKIKP